MTTPDFQIDERLLCEAGADAVICFAARLVELVQDTEWRGGAGQVELSVEYVESYSRLERIQLHMRQRGLNFSDNIEGPVRQMLADAGHSPEVVEEIWRIIEGVISSYAKSQMAFFDPSKAIDARIAATKIAETMIEAKGQTFGAYSVGDENEAYAIARRWMGIEDDVAPAIDTEDLRRRIDALVA